MSSGFLLLQASHDGSGLTFFLFIGWRLTHNQLRLILFREHLLSVFFFFKSCEARYVVENRRKNKAFKSSSRRFEDSVATVRVLRSDQSARYCTFFTANSEKSGIAH